MGTNEQHPVNTIVTLPNWQNFVFSSSAPMLAVLFTNPFDTAKVRLQLQGQTHAGQKIYRNSLDAMWKIGRNEGLRGLQQGITPAILREGSKNLFRIGMFEPLLRFLHPKDKYKQPPPIWKRLVAGSLSGAMGAVACNPFELIKTRMQARTKVSELIVGHQHNYKGVFSAIATIVRQEGFTALYRGAWMSVLRSTLGSGTNLSTYSALRDWILRNQYARDTPVTDVTISLISSFVTAFVMNPVDMLRTRVFNQPTTDRLYKNGFDALFKVLKKEGPFALYKGFLTSFMRLGPHFALTFMFLEQMKRMAQKRIRTQHEKKRIEDLSALFQQYDLDNNGKLDISEVKSMVKRVIPRQVDNYLSEVQYESLIENDVQRLFKLADADNSGYIEFSEFAKLVANLESLVREHELKAAFNYFDKNGDGKIDRNEILIALKAVRPLIHGVNIEDREYEEMLKQDVEHLMSFADIDHSGCIEFDEFVKVVVMIASRSFPFDILAFVVPES